jgi:hypothetical protein
MPQLVNMGATMMCSFGASPASLIVLPTNRTMAEGPPAATIMDHVPIVNIPTFGMCSAPTNPAFIAATAAKLGVATPVPCVPVVPAPWVPGSPTVMIGNTPALNNTCKCMCTWLGVITVSVAGTVKTNVA